MGILLVAVVANGSGATDLDSSLISGQPPRQVDGRTRSRTDAHCRRRPSASPPAPAVPSRRARQTQEAPRSGHYSAVTAAALSSPPASRMRSSGVPSCPLWKPPSASTTASQSHTHTVYRPRARRDGFRYAQDYAHRASTNPVSYDEHGAHADPRPPPSPSTPSPGAQRAHVRTRRTPTPDVTLCSRIAPFENSYRTLPLPSFPPAPLGSKGKTHAHERRGELAMAGRFRAAATGGQSGVQHVCRAHRKRK